MSKIKQQSTIKDMLLATIEEHIDAQNAKGMKKYGETLDDCSVDDYDWQQEIIQELIDALQYQQKEIGRLKALLPKSLAGYPISEKEQMLIQQVIGTSGNTLQFDSKSEPEQSPKEALDSAVGDYKAVSERDEIIEDLQDEVKGLREETQHLNKNADHWQKVANKARDELVTMASFLAHALRDK